MSDFEYLHKMSLGQYLPLGSFLHQRDPRAKLVGFSLVIISLTFANSLIGIGVSLVFVFLLLLISKVPIGYSLRGLLSPLPFLLFLALLQIFIFPHGEESTPMLEILGVGVFTEGLLSALRLLLRFCALIILFSIASAVISTLELIYGLNLLLKPLRRLGIRAEAAAMTLQITFRFVPFLAINAERIAKSQASRGAQWGNGKMKLSSRIRQFLPLLIPLFNGSINQAEMLADAMLARGYASDNDRTGLVDYIFSWKDVLFILVCGLVLCASFFL